MLNQISLREADYENPIWELEEGSGQGGRGGREEGELVLINPMAEEEEEEERSEDEAEMGEIRR